MERIRHTTDPAIPPATRVRATCPIDRLSLRPFLVSLEGPEGIRRDVSRTREQLARAAFEQVFNHHDGVQSQNSVCLYDALTTASSSP